MATVAISDNDTLADAEALAVEITINVNVNASGVLGGSGNNSMNGSGFNQ